jgi:hypothetical protein
MVCDLECLSKLVADIFMAPESAPSDDAKDQIRKKLDFNCKHLKAGSFWSLVEGDEEMDLAGRDLKCRVTATIQTIVLF